MKILIKLACVVAAIYACVRLLGTEPRTKAPAIEQERAAQAPASGGRAEEQRLITMTPEELGEEVVNSSTVEQFDFRSDVWLKQIAAFLLAGHPSATPDELAKLLVPYKAKVEKLRVKMFGEKRAAQSAHQQKPPPPQ